MTSIERTARCPVTPRTETRAGTRALLVVALTLLLAGAATVARAGWEYSGDQAEIFDLHGFNRASDPEGMATAPDGLGGLLVAAHDVLASPSQICVNRIAADGTELWGQGGAFVPRVIGSSGYHSPVAVAADGSGGAWVGFIVIWPTYELFELAHLTSTGSIDRMIPVDNPGTIGDYDHLSIKLLPLAGGDVFAAWTQRSPSTRLHAARFGLSGALRWHTDVNLNFGQRDYVVTNTRTSWDLTSDSADGALVTWLRMQVGTPEIGAQRITSGGTRAWGNDGHLLWSGYPLDLHDPVIVGDGGGGGYVVMSHLGRATAQHLSSAGAEMWVAGGIDIQNSNTPYWALSTDPAVCHDGFGGFFVIHGNDDLFAQHVDPWGLLYWGAGVAVGQRAGAQGRPDIAPDGAFGAVLAWEDYYYGLPGQRWRALVGTRLDFWGNTVWGPSDLYLAWTVSDPHDVALVSDGFGGALCSFARYDLSEHADDAWALGIGPNGVSGVEPAPVPPAIRLAASPNPFRSQTGITLDVVRSQNVRLTVHDPGGRLVRTLIAAPLEAGRRTLLWDGRDDRGRAVADGVYLIRLATETDSRAVRVARVR